MSASYRSLITVGIQSARLALKSESSSTSWTCVACRARRQDAAAQRSIGTRSISSSIRRQDDAAGRTISKVVDGLPMTPAATSSTLPSHSAKQQSAFSRRLSQITDSVLARASVAGQHINTYTGTDFSGIEALRKEIFDQEAEVKIKHIAVSDAKAHHREARLKQAVSQKEIVGLLERKSSWSPGDLERYMTLVRSEHVEDQSVQKASEQLAVAERDLEATRSLLEKLERKQYHEEQVWSDTIRRNSTWVTIGLMGVNIILLLAQISIFEPYRRRKIVKQIKEALDERAPAPIVTNDVIEQLIDLTVEPRGMTLEEIELGSELAVDTTATPAKVQPAIPVESMMPEMSVGALSARARGYVAQLFSENLVTLRSVDLTTVALKGAAAGMAAATVVALLLIQSTK